jgi:glycosyltransferase involved in cell wall biosynthesis
MSNTLPLVSVIIPVYNHENFIEQSLSSVWDQTYPNIEMIIIDDGSRDQSAAKIGQLIQSWKNKSNTKRKITFIKQTNKGAHHTINHGLSLAQGDYLTILNSDDYYSPHRIDTTLQKLQQHKAEWAFTGVQGIDSLGNALPLDHYWKIWYETNVWSSCIHLTIGFQLLKDNLAVTSGNLFFNRRLYEKVGNFNDYKLAHDLDYALRMLLFAEPIFIQEKLYFYRMHETNTLHQVHHLVDQERHAIYRHYLMQIHSKPPENRLAPCHWYWPAAFPKFRNDQKMDKGFLTDLIQPKIEKSSTAIPAKSFPAVLQTAIFKYFKPRALPWALAPPVLRTEQELCCYQPERLTVQQPRAAPWELFKDIVQSERLQEFLAGIAALSKGAKKKKITLITHTLCFSGAPKVVLDLARLLQPKGYQVNVISIWEGPLRKEFEALGISVYAAEKHINWFSPRTKIKKIYKLVKLLFFTFFKTKNTVICNCAVSWRLLFPLVLVSPFKKFFWYIHDSFSPSCMIDSGIAMNVFQKIKNKTNLKFWFGSDSTRKIWEEGVHGSVKYWSGIPKQISTIRERKKIRNILSVGSVMPRKAPHDLIDAFVKAVEGKRIPEDVTLTIVGFDENVGDPYLCELFMKKNQIHLKDRIRFIKQLDAIDLEFFYDQADLYIQSSVVECLPLALLQAMSVGLPIITTDVNGCAEAIEHKKTGYVCPARNSSILADMIVEAINHPEIAFQLGTNAQQKFNETFSLEKTQDEILRDLI